MKPFATIKAVAAMMAFRRALRDGDPTEIMRTHAVYGEWSVRREELPTPRFAKEAVEGFIEDLRGGVWDL